MFRTVFWLTALFIWCSDARLAAQNFRVQVAAFADSVPVSYFRDRGVNGVIASVDANNVHRYFFGSFPTRVEAEEAQNRLIAKGFTNACIIDLEEQHVLADQSSCAYFKGGPVFEARSDSVRFIYFDAGKSLLPAGGKAELDYMFQRLSERPNTELRILGFTDAAGSGKANLELATTRARIARNYLIDKGLAVERMLLRVFGESLAGNDEETTEKSSDLEEVRKLHRCVVLVLVEK